MKTSLILDQRVFEDAKKEAEKTGTSISEVVSRWAAMGREVWRQSQQKPRRKFKPLDLGKERVDLTSRRYWVEELEDDGN